ncbi:hypothetical protein U1Q18_002406, partial [Sarracenia purpurea var. burkii]
MVKRKQMNKSDSPGTSSPRISKKKMTKRTKGVFIQDPPTITSPQPSIGTKK